MRRVSGKFAKPGMVLGRPVYDSNGFIMFDMKTKLLAEDVQKLALLEVAEVIVEDPRVDDVPVMPLIPPELEAQATQALRQLLTENDDPDRIHPVLLSELEKPIMGMVRELFPDCLGEPSSIGSTTDADYRLGRPVRAAGLCLLLGRKAGMKALELGAVGLAAVLMEVGTVALPPGTLEQSDWVLGTEPDDFRRHPELGAAILDRSGRAEAVVRAVGEHHERWDGSGYPKGLKGDEISYGARILAIADAYFEMVSSRATRPGFPAQEAVEFVMAGAGDLFDPELVATFVHEVPLYPTGVTVKLNTGEFGIVSDGNVGFVGRPTIRICVSEDGRRVTNPYDLDLTEPENHGRLVVKVLEY